MFVRVICTALGIVAIAVVAVSAQQDESDQEQRWFDHRDANGDGVLTVNEMPEQMRRGFASADTDGNGTLTIAEIRQARARQQERQMGQRGESRQSVLQSGEAGVEVIRDIAYVEDDAHERHKLDIYLPADAASDENESDSASREPRPLVVWVHGGGWRNGDKRGTPATTLLEHGYVVASINYRLSGHAIFPAQVHDCKAAIRWLRANAETYNIDPQRIGVWGSSAGGHLVAMLGTSGDDDTMEGQIGVTGVSSRVQAVCDWFGPTDFTVMNRQAGAQGAIDHDRSNSPESLLLGGPVQQNPDAARAASPIVY
ncbi:MAG: alpha/beta hydrolase fold domain-containing protein, partial [Planctomycetota bacterium]